MMTQADKVLNHMKKRGSITSATAIGVYGISRLAAVINRIRAQGVTVVSSYSPGVTCSRVAEYHLGKTKQTKRK